ncbi:MAG: TetR/AcrR family transcriptional regulator [Eggerthellaceae bacterium]|nr:TetR/AcrR family transcriptional regulator [Eggerthellaceae bacterium]
MPRPKNDELKARIREEAWRQFRAQGYTATSYTSIAEACHVNRALVQYHCPKKEQLAIQLLERLLAASCEALGFSETDLRGNYQRIFQVGCCYFGFLMQRGYRRFLTDIIASRETTETVLAFNGAWALAHSGVPMPEGPALTAVMHAVITHMGGFYELLYHCLKTGEAMDVPARLAVVVDAFARVVGEGGEEPVEVESGREAFSAAASRVIL